jgi:membrane peptidoglycan carboxypeptidase
MPKKKSINHKTNNNHRSRKRSPGQVIKLVLQIFTLSVLIVILGVIIYFYLNYGKTILQLQSEAVQKVSASTSDTFRSAQTGLVYDAQGNLISKLKSEKDVYYLEFDKIPSEVIDAFVVSEDKKFFEHGGVDYLANVRAAIALIRHKGEITQGASTITQQLARAVFLTQEVTYKRKIEEIFAAQELEKKYTKNEIMEYYLNEIYFANGHYGIQAAAQAYFSQDISSLSLSQKVFLCAIPNSPNLYNPLTNMDNTLERRDRLLSQMYEDDKISETDYNTAIHEKIILKQSKSDKKNYVETYVYHSAIRALMKAQSFTFRYQFDSEEDETAYDAAYDELYYSCQKDLYVKGYRIYTSIDLKKQELLQTAVDEALKGFTEVNEEGVYQMQGAAVCIDNESGKVVAIVGGRDQDLAGYTLNRAYQSYRQPGSSIKPLIVYTPSFERNYTPASIVVDERFEGGPKNADNSYAGKMRLKRAIELSKNTIAWKLFQELTPEVGLSYLKSMNFAKIKESDYVPAAALGGLTVGVSPLEMASAYAAIESDGFYREPTCIISITDSEGNEIVGDNVEPKQIYQTNAARIMTEVLTGVITNGTAKGLGLTNTISAGKTGTTDDKKDGWFVGYTPYYTTSVWVGYDMPKSVSDLKGATYPGTIWHNFMEQIHTPSMTSKFTFYDWRSVLEESKEEQAIEQAEDKAIQNEEAMKNAAQEAADQNPASGDTELNDTGEQENQETAEDQMDQPDTGEEDTFDDGSMIGDTSADDTSEDGTVTDDTSEGGTTDDIIDDGTLEEGTEDDGTINDGTINDGTAENGTENSGNDSTDDTTIGDGSKDDTTTGDASTDNSNSTTDGTMDNIIP